VVKQAPTGEWIVITPEMEDEDPRTVNPNSPAFSDTPGMPQLPDKPDDFFHVLPYNDLFPHVLSLAECWCHPKLDEESGIVVHISADGREHYESGERKLN